MGVRKLRKTGAQTRQGASKPGVKAAPASLVSPAPAALMAQARVEHDSLLAVIQKYQKEFDDPLRKYDLLE